MTVSRVVLERLPSDMVARIYDALHELKDEQLHQALLAILWGRHGVAGGAWPLRRSVIGNPLNRQVMSDFEVDALREHTLIAYCGAGLSPRGRDDYIEHDAGHKLVRALDWSYIDIGQKSRRFRDFLCSCGRRTSDRRSSHQLVFKWRQVSPSIRVWPVVMVDDGGQQVPHVSICKYATHGEDPDHAPDSIGVQCLCGGYLGVHNAQGHADRLLPLY